MNVKSWDKSFYHCTFSSNDTNINKDAYSNKINSIFKDFKVYAGINSNRVEWEEWLSWRYIYIVEKDIEVSLYQHNVGLSSSGLKFQYKILLLLVNKNK